MAKVVDYYLSLVSPFAYLGSRRLEEIARRRRAEIRVKPVNYAEIFPKTGGLPLAKRAPERRAYRLVELKRWSAHLGVPLNPHPEYFPAPELVAACLVIAAGEAGGDPLRLAHAILRAVWAEERNIADAGTLETIARATGHHDPDLMAKALDPDTRATYEALTREALDRGVFGAPTYVYKDELFWGQDRLDFLDRALAA
ncbi:MAG: 2-hydroxychromene-2-carboxylate isomerase [Kiloniellaceae bacterium]